ncbi:MAG: bifunctional methionine sulfoxide reductase B/A protein [Planctomycetota bacterium]
MEVLSEEEERVIVHKGTERAFTGRYDKHYEVGRYRCRRCGTALFESSTKFNSRSGWPSFDDALKGAVKEIPDADGQRVEIVCAKCGGHLGHVFRGEGFTEKNTRHCVNSISLDFVAGEAKPKAVGRALFAGGCFWGVEYYLERVPGVKSVTSGYTGGHVENPTYDQVCSGKSGHIEAVEVLYDPDRVSYEALAKLFFEIHDPTQLDRQGPDISEQYRSEVYYTGDEQRRTVEALIAQLKERGFDVKTRVSRATTFYPAESYHQDYYKRTGKSPYCHRRVPRFGRE